MMVNMSVLQDDSNDLLFNTSGNNTNNIIPHDVSMAGAVLGIIIITAGAFGKIFNF